MVVCITIYYRKSYIASHKYTRHNVWPSCFSPFRRFPLFWGLMAQDAGTSVLKTFLIHVHFVLRCIFELYMALAFVPWLSNIYLYKILWIIIIYLPLFCTCCERNCGLRFLHLSGKINCSVLYKNFGQRSRHLDLKMGQRMVNSSTTKEKNTRTVWFNDH